MSNRRKKSEISCCNRLLVSIIVILTSILVNADIDSLPMNNIILDTDMTFDVDDVGALATLHTLANQKKAQILAIMYNEVHPHGTRAIRAVNAWYNRSEIPLGEFRGKLNRPDTSRYLTAVANLCPVVCEEPARDALSVYREVLSDQADQDTIIVSIGFLNNLELLLREENDLVRRKVKELVVMGGRHHDNFNLFRHELLASSKYVLRNWPTPVAVTDFGHNVLTGRTLQNTDPNNPVREAYYHWFNGRFQGRSSWDQIAVLYGVEGVGKLFKRSAEGSITFRDGDELALESGIRYVIDPTKNKEFYQNHIENLMVAPNEP